MATLRYITNNTFQYFMQNIYCSLALFLNEVVQFKFFCNLAESISSNLKYNFLNQ